MYISQHFVYLYCICITFVLHFYRTCTGFVINILFVLHCVYLYFTCYICIVCVAFDGWVGKHKWRLPPDGCGDRPQLTELAIIIITLYLYSFVSVFLFVSICICTCIFIWYYIPLPHLQKNDHCGEKWISHPPAVQLLLPQQMLKSATKMFTAATKNVYTSFNNKHCHHMIWEMYSSHKILAFGLLSKWGMIIFLIFCGLTNGANGGCKHISAG